MLTTLPTHFAQDAKVPSNENMCSFVTNVGRNSTGISLTMLRLSDLALKESDFHTNNLGRELNRQTITGDAEVLYKCLMELYAGKHLTDDEFFPMYVKAHIDRGAMLLDQEQRYGGDFLIHLTELEKGL